MLDIWRNGWLGFTRAVSVVAFVVSHIFSRISTCVWRNEPASGELFWRHPGMRGCPGKGVRTSTILRHLMRHAARTNFICSTLSVAKASATVLGLIVCLYLSKMVHSTVRTLCESSDAIILLRVIIEMGRVSKQSPLQEYLISYAN